MKKMIFALALCVLVYGQKQSQNKGAETSNNYNSISSSNRDLTIPRTLSYQGLLTKSDGRPVEDGSYSVTFRFFNSLIGGDLLWEENQNIEVKDGIISATLGSETPVDFNSEESYLEIVVEDVPLSPRQTLTSVLYSIKSDTANYSQGGDYSDLDNLPDLSVYAIKDTLANFPLINSLDSVAFTGDYNSLSNIPDLTGFTQSDTLSQYTLTSALGLVALSNEYTDLNNTPDLTVYATNDTLSPVAFSNEYDDLSNAPDLTVFATNDTLNEYVLDDNVGTIASQNFDDVTITGGSVTGITDVTVADGGTGASDVATARQNLGLEIGVDVQGYDADVADLADGELSADRVQYMQNVTSDIQEQLDAVTDPGLSQIATLNSEDGNIIVGSADGWVVESGATARTSLGLGTISTQASDNVTITGGSVTGITDVTVADGGTGASDVATARQNLGLEIGVDVQGYDADLADLADGTLSASKVESGEYFIPSAGTNGQVWTSDGDGAGSWQASTSTVTGAASTIDTEVLDASRAVVSNADGNIAVSDVTSTELGYLDGVTSNVQTQLDAKQNSDVNLDALAGLAHRDGNIIVSDGNTWTVESGSDARTSLGLGSIATQGADNVAITGGTVRGITDVTVADGGTGASDVATARQNLGLEIGVDVQGYDADLADLADGTLSASKVESGEYFIPSAGTNGQVWTSDGDGAGSWQASTSTVTGAASTIDTEVLDASRAVVSNADGNIAVSDVTSTELGYLDGVTSNVQTQLDGKGTVSTLSDLSVTATAAELNILDGVTATALELNALDGITATVTELNYTDGVTSNIQTQLDGKQGTDADLTAIAGLDNSDGNIIVGSAGGWVVESGATARTSLGLGTISTQASDNVTITGGSVTGITDVTVADGGTGASDVATARQNLGLEIGVDVQGYDADLADLADGTLSASKVESGEYFIPSAGTNGQVWTSDGDGAGAWSNVTANTVSITDNENENETNALIFSSNGDVDGGEMILESDGDATYNPSTGVISASGFNGETVTVSNSVDISGSNGLILENDETITNSTDGTLLLTSTTTSLTGDLTVSGNDIVFGNGETISNSRNGVVVVAATTIEASGNLNVGDGSSSGIIASKGDFDLTIQTGNSSTGSITITDGANGNIAVSPNGSGAVQLDGLSWPTADGSANQVLKTDGSGSLSWTDVSSTISGSASTIDTEVLDASRAVVSNADGNIAVSDVTSTELGYLDGVTSNVQTQLDGKGTVSTLSDLSVTATAAELNILDGVTATALELNALDGITATVTELNYTDGVTSNIQTQLDGKQGTDADLTAIAGLDNSDGNIIVGSAGGWVVESGATARTSLGLGTISTQASDNVTITGGAIDGAALGGTSASTGAFTSVTASTSLDVTGSTGIILENDETVTNSTDGTVLINGTVAGGTGSAAGVFTSNGDQDVTIQTGNSTTGSITITDGANGNIAITPNGSGAIQLDGLSWPTADGSANQVLKTDGSGTLSWSAAATAINGLSDALVEETGSMYLGNDPSNTTDGADFNVSVGTTALDAITTGYSNTALGYNSLTANLAGDRNTAVGANALKSNTTGITNVAVGSSALESNTTANRNTSVGHASSFKLSSGQNNVTLGYEASKNITGANDNVIIGSGANPSADTGTTNQIVLGKDATGQADNSVVLGNADVTAIYMAQDKGATVHAAGADLSGSTGLILENDETITNSTDGTVLINGTVAGGTGSAEGVFTSNGDQDVTIQTGNSTTGSITITDGANGNIAITPNGSGAIQLDGLSWPTADGSSNQVLKTDGSGTLSWTTPSTIATTVTVTDNEDTNEGNALIFAADADLDGGTISLESDGDATYNPSTGTISATNFNGNLTGTLQTAAQPNVTSLGTLSSIDIDGGAIDGATIGANSASTGAFTSVTASTSLDITGSTGIILENDETITNSTDGTVLINGTVAGGTGSAAGVFTSNGDQDVTIQTGNSTTGSITITDGANGNIAITPNGSGAIQLDGLSWPTADGSADQVLKTDGSGTLSWTAASSGASNVNGLSDALIEDNSLYLGQDPSSTTSTAEYNLSVGATALDAVTTGDYNIALGYDALSANTTGTTNTAVGYGTLKHNVEAGANTAVGDLALRQLKTSTAATYNTAVGRASQRGPNNEAQFHTGERNTSVGAGSMKVITTGNDNTAVGYWSQYGASITGDYNTSIGSNSLKNLDSGDKNISVGHEAGDVITSGSNNVIIGSGSDPSASSASNQTVIGYNVTGQADNSVVLGNADVTAIYMAQDKGATVHAAGADLSSSTGLILENDETITNSTDGTVLINGTVAGGTGSAAGVFTSNGDQDVTIQTGNSTTGSITITDGANGNIAITPNGSGAIQLDGLSWPTADGSADQVLKTDGSGTLSWTAASSGASNVNGLSDALIEDNSLYLGQDPSSTTSTAEYNLSVGATALDAVTTGDANIAIGHDALSTNTTGSGNIAIGYGAYDNADTEGNNMAIGRDALGGSINGGETNIAIGNYSLDANTSGDLNIGLGYVSLTQNSTGSSNVGIGNSAMQLNQTGSSNTTLGNNSMKSSLSSSYNTAVGAEALFDANRTADTDGYNTALGYNAGNTGTNDITTGNKNTILGASTAASAAAGTNQTVIGFGASGTADNSVTIGNSSVTAWYPGSDDTADLGSNSVEFKDLYIDGTANLDAVDIDGGAIDGTVIGANSASTGVFTTITASTSLDVTGSAGIVLENDETITNSTDTQINMSSTTLVLGNGSNDPTIQSNGNKDLTLKTGATNTGSIVIRDGSNNNIDLAPHGTGKVDMNDSPLTGYGADLQTESGTSKTLAASDNGTIIVCSSNSAVTITVPASLPAGFNCMIIQSGSGQVSLSASSTTLNNRNGTKTAGQHAIMTVVHLGSDAYVVSGDTSSS